jgi:hypothetical protein
LVLTILRSLPPHYFETEEEALAEALRRSAELDAHPEMGISFEEFQQRISRLFYQSESD